MVSSARWLAAVWSGFLLLPGEHASGGDPPWREAAQTGSFIYRADFHLVERNRLLAELEQLRTELFKTLALPPPQESIELYLFHDEAAYRDYLAQRFGDLPRRRALYIKAGGPGMVYAFRGEQFVVDLRHEMTHAFLHAALRGIPLWLDEGLAEYFEIPPPNRPSADPHHQDLAHYLAVRQLPPLESLEAWGDSAGMRREDYLAAWAWIHFLLHAAPATRGELIAHLAEWRSGEDTVPLSLRLRAQVPGLQQSFESHVARLGVRATCR